MYRIGLTGGVGSGKSTVSNYMHTLGIPVIDGDKLARALHQAVTTRCMDPIPCVSTITQGKPLDLAALEQEIGGQGKNASYDRSTGQVVEGRVGVTFDVAGAEKLVEDAQPGQEIVIPAQITYPTL